jgi:hypothetical protein
MTMRTETMPETDAVALLMHQHEQIRGLLDEVGGGKGQERAGAFERLCRLLAVHEAAEEQIVHPVARRSLKNGPKVINARLAEELELKKMLQALEVLGVSARGFAVLFGEFREAVVAHVDREERAEFPELRRHSSAERRVMCTAIRAVEATAPTHPHPGMETTAKSMLIGPFVSVADRTQDLARRAMSR